LSLLIHFTETDLGRVTVADSPDPLWETLLALHALQASDAGAAAVRWRTRVELPPTTRALLGIAPARGYSPDFLTPQQSAEGLDAGLEAILATDGSRLRAELGQLFAGRTVPHWARRLATGEPAALRELTEGLKSFHRSALTPYWADIVESVRDDRVAKARTLLDTGLDGLLSSLHPLLTWADRTLELHGSHVVGELALEGRGLRLVPSFFCQAVPTVLADPELPPVLVYPIGIDPRRMGLGTDQRDDPATALAALLGKTRAQLLAGASHGSTTTELGKHAGISPAAASYHASILRAAGLITTRRQGSAVRHTLTDLGSDLMTGQHAGLADVG
jgi:DNA-binding transcriptional ArsR family regulator